MSLPWAHGRANTLFKLGARGISAWATPPSREVTASVLFLLCRLLKEQEEKENKIASLIAEQSDEK